MNVVAYTLGHVDDKANKLHAIASLRVLLDATKEQTVVNGRETNETEVSGTLLCHKAYK